MQEKNIPFKAGIGLDTQQEGLLSQRHFPILASLSSCSDRPSLQQEKGQEEPGN